MLRSAASLLPSHLLAGPAKAPVVQPSPPIDTADSAARAMAFQQSTRPELDLGSHLPPLRTSQRTEDIEPSSPFLDRHAQDENRDPYRIAGTRARDDPSTMDGRGSPRAAVPPTKRPRLSADSGYADTSMSATLTDGERHISDSDDGHEPLRSSAQRRSDQAGGQEPPMELEREERGGETQMEQESMAVSRGSPELERRGSPEREQVTIEVRYNDTSENSDDWSLDKLRSERQMYTDRLCSIMSQLMEIMSNNGGKSSEGNDSGFLRHSRSYVEERAEELKALISRREAQLLVNPARAIQSNAQVPRPPPSVARSHESRQAPSVQHGTLSRASTSSSVVGSSQASATLAKRKHEEQIHAPASEGLKSAYFGRGNVTPQSNFTPRPRAIETTEPLRFSHPSHISSDSAAPAPAQSISRVSSFRPAQTIPARRPPPPAAQSLPRTIVAQQHPAAPTPTTRDKGKGRAIVVEDFDQLLDGVDFDESYRDEDDMIAEDERAQLQMRQEREETEDEELIPARAQRPLPAARRAPPPVVQVQTPVSLPARRAPAGRPAAPPKQIVTPVAPIRLKVVPAPKRVAVAGPAGGEADPARLSSAPRLTHPWSRDVSKALRQRFGLAGFRQNQEDAINATLAGKDVFVLLPTGGGKSLCFQLPAVVQSGKTKGVTIVVSPLLSLISDQCKSLMEKDIPVVFINGSMNAADRSFALSMLTAEPPMTCLAYVTPELIANSGQFRGILSGLFRRKQLARFVIDEAHCVSSWGHDFRPDYKQMSCLKQDYPGIPLIALTATANDRVKRDILDNLGMRNSLVLTQSFNRPNLKYEVRPKGKKVIEDIASFIKNQHAGECGIIYCHSKAKCEETADKLRREYKIEARHYHAGMSTGDRIRIQTGWQEGEFQVICATIAFGMGIDKADVRYVIHFSLSGSLEAYYQETGRAGRDGKTSVCVLFFAYADTRSINHLIDKGEGTFVQKEYNRDNLRRVVQYCLNLTDCRRSQVLQYFGEQFPQEKCHKTCDNCLRGEAFEFRDVTDVARSAVNLVQELQHEKGVTVALCVSILRGSKVKKIMDRGWNESEWHNSASGMDLGDVERLFQLLLNENVLGERFETLGAGHTHSYVITGKRKQELLSGKLQLSMAFSDPARKKIGNASASRRGVVEQDADEEYEEEEEEEPHYEDEIELDEGAVEGNDLTSQCLQELIILRKTSAARDGCSPTELVRDDTLQVAAATLPITSQEWAAIEGADDQSMEWYLASAKAICVRYSALSGRVPSAARGAVPASRPPPAATKRAPVASGSKAAAGTIDRSLSKPVSKSKTIGRAPTKSKATNATLIKSFAYSEPKGKTIKAMPVFKR